ncbi:hypothetical protein BHM03_00030579 [Ensete ventricosum]|nr:hypothetical protein BHM03_00030579 [Ensete ventricosum]
MLRLSVTLEWVGEGELPKKRIQSEVAKALRCVGRGHTWRDHSLSLSHKNLNTMEMSPGGGTSVELSVPFSQRGRALVVKGAEEVKNVEANSKYQDNAEGQRPRNFIRPVWELARVRRELAKGIRSLPGWRKGVCRKKTKTRRLAERLAGSWEGFGLHPKKIGSGRWCASRRRTRKMDVD